MSSKAPLAAVVLSALAAAGCVDQNTSFFISSAQLPAAGCMAPLPGAGSTFLSRGTLDVSGKTGYLLFPQVENAMASSAGGTQVNALQMREYRMEIDMGQIPGTFPDQLLSFSERTSGYLPPGGKIVSGVWIVPDELAALLAGVVPANVRTEIIVEVRAVADKVGSEMETGPFAFPIDICNGCLVDMRATCPDLTKVDPSTYDTNVCGLPQDSPVTCCSTPTKRCLKTSNL